jgi:hypothetical protein
MPTAFPSHVQRGQQERQIRKMAEDEVGSEPHRRQPQGSSLHVGDRCIRQSKPDGYGMSLSLTETICDVRQGDFGSWICMARPFSEEVHRLLDIVKT